MYAAVELDGKIYRVKLTVREQADKNKTNVAYSYEVVEIELSDGSPYATDAAAVQPLSDAPNNSISLAKLLKNVRMSYAEAGKEANFLLDESRKRDEKDKARMIVAETVRSVADELQDKFGVEVEVVDSLDGVKNEQARMAINDGINIKGWYDPKTGKVCIYAPNAESAQDIMVTYAHEVVAHKGMRGLLGKERYEKLCKRLGEALTPEQRELVREYIDMGKSDGVLGDEYIARIAEMLIDEKGDIKEPTTWEKVKGVVREFFRDVLGLELTDADIRYLLWRSGERLRRNKVDVLTRAQDVVTGQQLGQQAETQRSSLLRFIGEKGAARADQSEEATIRTDNLRVAQEMETAGKAAKNIKLATGWERGADGLWRYEENDEEIKQLIDNFFAKYEDNERKRKALYEERQRRQDEYIKASKSRREYWREKSIKTGEYTRWGEEVILTPLEKLDKDLWNTNNELNRLVDEILYGEVKDYLPANSLLLAEYPELGSVKFNFVSYLDEGVDGQYSKGPWPGDQGAINLRRGLSKSESYRTLTHEVQHAIQQIEGFAVGSNPKAERSFDRYNKISGEVEARNASRRMDMSDEQRRSSLAIDTEDVARNDQVVSFRRRENPLMTESERNETMSRVNDAFNTQLRSFAPETADKTIFKLGRPSDILIAAGVVDKEMKLYGSKLLKKIREHGFALSEIKDLPLSIASPIAVFDNHRSGSNRAILTELRTADGNILVTIEVGKGGDVDFNIVSSVFGKRGNSVVNWINKGYATYIDKEKALSYLHLSAPIAEATESQELALAAKVIQEFENPKTNRQNSNDSTRFNVGQQGRTTNASLATVKETADNLQQQFGVEVEVVESLAGVQNEKAREAIDKGKPIKGWYEPSTGKVCIYAPNAESEQDVMVTYAHEVVAHKGMRGLLGKERYEKLCERLGAALTPEQLELVEEYEGSSTGVLGDEYIARIAEMLIDEKGDIKEPTTWEKVKGAVRDFFRDVFGIDLTDADIRYLLWRSGERLRRNKADAFTRAQDVVTGQKLQDESMRMRQEEADYQREIREITERAKADGTFMKAPNGKPSNLNERQWAHVRSTRFKQWFGDWEKAVKRAFLMGNNYVSRLIGDEFTKDGVPLTEKVPAYYHERYGGVVHRDGLGDAILDRRSVKDSLSHGISRNKSAAFAAVGEIITDGMIIDTQKDWKGRNINSVTIAAPIEIGGKGFVGVVIVTRGSGTNTNRFYLHEVILQESLQDESIKTDTKADSHQGDVAKILKNIASTSENVSKVVDENGESLVVTSWKMEKSDALDVSSTPGPNVRNDSDIAKVKKEIEIIKKKAKNCSKVVGENGEKTVHSYEATEIGLLAGQTEKGVPSSRNSNNSIYAANLLQGIESANNPGTLLLENHSKVVDKNGESQVVYRGTSHFGSSVLDDRDTYFGIFFSTKARTAAAYTGKAKATFPRITDGLPRHDGGWRGMSPVRAT